MVDLRAGFGEADSAAAGFALAGLPYSSSNVQPTLVRNLATAAFTPSMAIEQAHALVESAVAAGGAAQFRHVQLKPNGGAGLVFCGQVNTRDADGVASGWKGVMILVSGNPDMRGVVVDRGRTTREMISGLCQSGESVDGRDYSAVLSVQ